MPPPLCPRPLSDTDPHVLHSTTGMEGGFDVDKPKYEYQHAYQIAILPEDEYLPLSSSELPANVGEPGCLSSINHYAHMALTAGSTFMLHLRPKRLLRASSPPTPPRLSKRWETQPVILFPLVIDTRYPHVLQLHRRPPPGRRSAWSASMLASLHRSRCYASGLIESKQSHHTRRSVTSRHAEDLLQLDNGVKVPPSYVDDNVFLLPLRRLTAR